MKIYLYDINSVMFTELRVSLFEEVTTSFDKFELIDLSDMSDPQNCSFRYVILSDSRKYLLDLCDYTFTEVELNLGQQSLDLT